VIDASSQEGKRILRRLEEELVVWLTTGGERPQSVPVWFLWERDSFLVFSFPGRKVCYVEAHPRFQLNFNSTRIGGDDLMIVGRAEVLVGNQSDYMI